MPDEPSTYERFTMTPAIARNWYGHSLVAGTKTSKAISSIPSPADQEAPISSPEPRLEVLVFLRPLSQDDQERGMQFLAGVLNACKLTLNDVALFKGAGPGDLETLRTTCNPRAMLLFGIDPTATGLPLHVPHFQVMDHGGIKILSAPPIEEMIDDKPLKSALWTGLKKIFTT